ncbi:hypothetical protein HPP92_007045 [Vanilla planifolia]|uniref:protein-serine/threonine phosphatase n=1 Tax=Vanilla planifolia TaxID=51239 RepID=A0A835V8J9_VANPL|nr:hypothetical protein HPP92_007294 [Vanilla planifolia]KAG0490182.1 hypothetical protein HPP92_007045 [Vanilla planifolia]
MNFQTSFPSLRKILVGIHDLGRKMAAGADLSHAFIMLDGSYGGKEIASSLVDEDPNSPKGMEQLKVRKPPRQISIIRHCVNTALLANSAELDLAMGPSRKASSLDGQSRFLPVFRSGSCSEIGPKTYMEDEHICIDNLTDHLGVGADFLSPGAFYGVFDGHGGKDAASFVCNNLLKFVIEDQHFPTSLEKALKSAFVMTDHAFADTRSLDRSSGTTALTALIFGRTMLIANAGDCRAVLGKRGKAIELSRDHKPNCNVEKLRIEELGGIVSDGYLNGQLSVARAIGDWHMKGPKGSTCPLSAEPELQKTTLTDEDEFLVMGCDGLWDVMSSQCAVTIVRRELMDHNDPERCSRELVREALKRNSCDNLTVIVVCFSSDPPPRIDVPKTRVRRSISLEGLHLLKGVLDSNG